MPRKPKDSDSDDGMKNEKTSHSTEKLTAEMILWSGATADADVYMKSFDYGKAEEFYTRAIKLQPTNIHTLVCRSKCRALNGNHKGALADAENVLELEPQNSAAHMCKANALFTGGDFELALVWYVRGSRVKQSELDQLALFEQGQYRCKEAIKNAIDSFDVVKLKAIMERKKLASEKLSVAPNQQQRLKKKVTQSSRPTNSMNTLKGSSLDFSSRQLKSNRMSLSGNQATIAQNLLEEIYDDYVFLRDLEVSPSIRNAKDPIIDSHIQASLDYLEGRIEFWRARNPKAFHDSTIIDQVIKSGKPVTRIANYLRDSKGAELSNKAVLPKIMRDSK